MLAPPLSMMATSVTRGSSQHAFAARQLRALDAEGLAQRPADALEAGLDHVMRVLALHLDVDRRAEGLAERTEEVRHQFGRQAADGFTPELAFEYRVGPAGQVDGDLCAGLVHRQQESEARDAALVAERLAQRLA